MQADAEIQETATLDRGRERLGLPAAARGGGLNPWLFLLLPILVYGIGACAPLPSATTQPTDEPRVSEPSAVGFTSRTFTRTTSDGQTRRLTTDIWYPARPNQHPDVEANLQIGAPANVASANDVRHPLVVFSHGLGGSPIGASILLTELAAAGCPHVPAASAAAALAHQQDRPSRSRCQPAADHQGSARAYVVSDTMPILAWRCLKSGWHEMPELDEARRPPRRGIPAMTQPGSGR